MKRTEFAAALGSSVVASAIAAPALGQTLDTVNIGSVNSVADTPFVVADRKGYFRDAGIRANFVHFDAAANMVAPLGTGQLDVGGGAPSAGLYNAIARGISIKIVADRGSDPPGYGFSGLLVRKDLVTSGKYKTYADLKGMKMAEPAKGTSDMIQVVKACEKGGLKYDDVEHIFMSFSDMVVAFRGGAIDAAMALEPWATQAINDGFAVRIAGSDAYYPNQQITVVVYSSSFGQTKPDVAKRFMVAYVRALRFYRDALRNGHLTGPTANEMISIMATDLHLDPAVLRQMVAASMDPNGRVNAKSLTEDYNIYKQFGLINGNVDMDKVIDMSFVDAAVATLGTYKPAR
jgi:NitT/TauT family transport system substrate-binding protein